MPRQLPTGYLSQSGGTSGSIRDARASFRLNRNGALSFCFDAFSSREPVSTSLENALERDNGFAREFDFAGLIFGGQRDPRPFLTVVLDQLNDRTLAGQSGAELRDRHKACRR